MRPSSLSPRRLVAAALTTTGLLGCAAGPLLPPPQGVTARGAIAWSRPGLRLAAVPEAHVAADVDEIGVELWESTALDLAGLEAEEALAATRSIGAHLSPTSPLAIGNLKANATYGVRLTAHDNGVRIDDASSACLTLIQTGLDDEVPATFRIRLANTYFAGSTHGHLDVSGATATSFTAADVATTTITLRRLPDGPDVLLDVASTASVTMLNLQRNTDYRVTTQARDAAGGRIDACEVETASCSVTFSVTTDDAPPPVQLPLVLKDNPPPS